MDPPTKPTPVPEEEPFPSSAFDALERDFQSVLSELVSDHSLDKFRVEV